MTYETYGEFELPCKVDQKRRALNFSKEALSEFWTKVDEHCPGLSVAVGCYIFAIRAAKGIRPWYVGQTVKSFKDECFHFHKRDRYRQVFDGIKKGTPVIILVARRTPSKGKLAKSLQREEANFVEQLLISRALSKNPRLANVKNTKYSQELILPGVLNNPKGYPSPGAKLLRSVVGTK